MSTGLSAMDKANAAWGGPGAGETLPDWIKALAEACDERGLRKTAARLDVSPAMVSLAINKERAKLDFVKVRVERTLMVTIVTCPVLGLLGKNECRQEQAQPFSSANPLRVQLFRACRGGCPNYKETKK